MTRLRLAIVGAVSVALTACTQDRVELVKPPADLTACAGEPATPYLPPVDWTSVDTARPVQRQRDQTTLDYILSLRSAWGDCSSKVAGVKAWSDGLK